MAAKGIEFKGFSEADEKFRKMALVLDSDKVTAIVFRGTQMVRSEVERRAPRGGMYSDRSRTPGRLRKAAMAVPMARKAGKPAGAIVLINYSPRRGIIAPHAHLVEGGTKPHVIKAKNGKHLVLFGRIFREQVQHPGAKGFPFFRDAVAASRGAARTYIRTELTTLIETTAAQN